MQRLYIYPEYLRLKDLIYQVIEEFPLDSLVYQIQTWVQRQILLLKQLRDAQLDDTLTKTERDELLDRLNLREVFSYIAQCNYKMGRPKVYLKQDICILDISSIELGMILNIQRCVLYKCEHRFPKPPLVAASSCCLS